VNTKNNRPYTTTWGFAGTLCASIVIMAGFVVTQISTLATYISLTHGNVSANEFDRLISELQHNGTAISLCTFSSLAVCSLMIVAAIKFKEHSNLTDYLGLKKPSLGEIKYWLIIITCLMLVSDMLTILLDKPVVPEFMQTVYLSGDPVWLLWLALIIGAPLFEELFFRGFIITGLASSFTGPIGAIVLSAVIWSVIHLQYDLYGIITIFITGVILGVARLKTDSVLLCIGMHASINLIACIQAAIITADKAI